jgi:hypothetical protein
LKVRATLETLSTKTQKFAYLGGAVAIAICRAILGNLYRAKYTTTWTYGGNTNVRIDLMKDGLTASP